MIWKLCVTCFEKHVGFLVLFIIVLSCREMVPDERVSSGSRVKLLERISYLPVSSGIIAQTPAKYRLTYYFKNGHPHRWLELDSNKVITTDYLYDYGANWVHVGARYIEPGDDSYSHEVVSYSQDSLEKTTTWIDSAGNPYYKMLEYLRADGQPEKAAFIGDELHGYDSAYYTPEGFESRIFFTNVKGRIFNDRSFKYDSISTNGDWLVRRKFMGDTLQEIHHKEIYYHGDRIANPYCEGVISLSGFDEDGVSLSQDDQLLFFTRSLTWDKKVAYLARKDLGLFTQVLPISELDTIYNGAISPSGNKIIFCRKHGDAFEVWLAKKKGSSWIEIRNLTVSSGIQGGYFNWLDEERIYFYVPDNEGDIVLGLVKNDSLRIVNALDEINTSATEFSPFVAKDRSFIIFTRYLEGDPNQQGFFISKNMFTPEEPEWGVPRKINALPYGWGAFISSDQQYFFYTDGNDIYSHLVSELDL